MLPHLRDMPDRAKAQPQRGGAGPGRARLSGIHGQPPRRGGTTTRCAARGAAPATQQVGPAAARLARAPPQFGEWPKWLTEQDSARPAARNKSCPTLSADCILNNYGLFLRDYARLKACVNNAQNYYYSIITHNSVRNVSHAYRRAYLGTKKYTGNLECVDGMTSRVLSGANPDGMARAGPASQCLRGPRGSAQRRAHRDSSNHLTPTQGHTTHSTVPCVLNRPREAQARVQAGAT